MWWLIVAVVAVVFGVSGAVRAFKRKLMEDATELEQQKAHDDFGY